MIAKAYRTTSSEAPCILAVTTPNIFKAENATKRYDVWKGHRAKLHNIDREVGLFNWPHHAGCINILKTNGCDDQTIRIYSDGRKGEGGVVAGLVIFVNNELIARHKFRMNHSW